MNRRNHDQEYVQQCTLANIQAARETGQWVIHDPNRQASTKELLDLIRTELLKRLPEKLDAHIHTEAHEDIYSDLANGWNKCLAEIRTIIEKL